MNKHNTRSVICIAAAFVLVVLLMVGATLSASSPPQASRSIQYKVISYTPSAQGGSPQELEGLLNRTGKEGWKFVQCDGTFLIFQK